MSGKMSGKIVIEFTPAEFDLLVAAADALITEMGMLGGDSRADEAVALLDRLRAVLKENGGEINFVNLTPSDIIMFGDKNTLIPSSGGVDDVQCLPEPKERTWFIVSPEVANAAKGRRDLLIPDPNHVVRDESGIIGYRALAIVR